MPKTARGGAVHCVTGARLWQKLGMLTQTSLQLNSKKQTVPYETTNPSGGQENSQHFI